MTDVLHYTPGFRRVKTEVKPLTPELATYMRDLPASKTERHLDDKRLASLRQKFAKGLLLPFNWVIARDKSGNEVRMNGQHSSNVLCGMDGAFPKDGIVVLSEYVFDSLEGQAMLFRQLDARESSRTALDVSGAHQGLQPDLHEIDRRIAKLGAESVAWFKTHIEGFPSVGGDDRYTAFNDPGVRVFLLWLATVLSSKTPELKRQYIVAAMYGSHLVNAQAADVFWKDVARGGNGEDHSPSTVLDTALREIAESNNEDGIKPAEFYNGCANAWNLFRADKTMSSVKFDTRKGMITLAE